MRECLTERRSHPAAWAAMVTILTIGATLLLIELRPAEPAASQAAYATPRWAIVVHLGTVLPALLIGPVILVRTKGDWLHKLLGRTWVALMAITALTSFWIRGPSGALGGIHILSALTLVALPVAVWRIRSGDVERHRQIMISLYIGLLVAGAFALAPDRLAGSFVRQLLIV